jgi:peptidoglycan/LPS O-acetylase OafA/YrhL
MTAGAGERVGASSRSNAFDLLRLVGALAVLVEHSWLLAGHGYPLFPAGSGTTFGRIGVGIFFFTSGYLITASWLADPSMRRFAVRRALRIYPLYGVVVVVLALVVGPLLSTRSPLEYFGHPQTWTYLWHNLLVFPTEFELPGVFSDAPAGNAVNGSFWTIPTEVLCYVAVVALGVFGALRHRWITAAVALGMIAVTAVVSVTDYSGPLVPQLLDARAAEQLTFFALGAAAFLFPASRRLPWWATAVAALAWLLTWGTPAAQTLGVIAIAATALAVAFRTTSRLHHPTGRYDLSYGTYLLAYPVQQILVMAGVRNPWAALALTVVVVLPMAAGTWRFLERPALAFKPRRPAPTGA